MRIGGVSVGKVKTLELPAEERSTARTRPGDDRDRSRVRADLRGRAGDPAPEDAARRDLRRADLGLEPDDGGAGLARRRSERLRRRGGRRSRRSPRAATWPTPRSRTRPRSTRSSTRSTRRPASSFQRWQANAAVAIQDRGLDLNDAFGNLGPFITDASDVLETLNAPEGRAQGPRPRHRHGLRRAHRRATRSSRALIIELERRPSTRSPPQDRALAETFQILPTFQRESRATLDAPRPVRRRTPSRWSRT